MDCFLISITILFTTMLILLFVAYMSYSFFVLYFCISDWNIFSKCDESNLILYTILSYIVNFITPHIFCCCGSCDGIIDIEIISLSYCTYLFIIYSALLSWGGVELFNKSCDLKESNLWKLNFVMIILYGIIVLGVILISLYKLISKCYQNFTENKTICYDNKLDNNKEEDLIEKIDEI